MTSGTHPTPLTPTTSVGVALLATATGGAVGAVLRWSLTSTFPVAAGHFPWTVLGINVLGSGLLACLPLLTAVRKRPWLLLLLSTGLLGGFTTMSAASADTFALLDHGDTWLALAYCLGTLGAAVLAVTLVERLGEWLGGDHTSISSARGGRR
jgi:CrcB protein